MSARIYDRAEWNAARRRRAQRGKAPRLAIERGILLRQVPGGQWSVAIQERCSGIWRKPEHLYGVGTFEQARTAALAAWNRLRLPLYWSRTGERLQAYHVEAHPVRTVWA